MKWYFILCLCLIYNTLQAQTGCTDTEAINYNPSASSNDGSCTYRPSAQSFTLLTNTINVSENSGIEWINGKLFTFADSGNPPNFYRVDPSTGSIIQTIHVANYPNVDWEDITSDDDYVYIGDFGNNDGNRTDLKILKISLSLFLDNPSSTISVNADAISFAYTDQTNFSTNSNSDYNCEAVISIQDSLYIFTKDEGDLQTRVYALSKNPGEYLVDPYTSYNVNGRITGAAYNSTNNEVALVGYLSGHYSSFIWYLYDFNHVDFFSGNKRRIEIGNATQKWQTEGIAYNKLDNTNLVYVSCENNGGIPAGVYTTIRNEFTTNSIDKISEEELTIKYLNDNTIMVSCISNIDLAMLYNIYGQVENSSNIHFIDNNSFIIQPSNSNKQSINVLKIKTSTGQIYRTKILR